MFIDDKNEKTIPKRRKFMANKDIKEFVTGLNDRFDKGIEESIYMPKISFEKEMEISKEASLDEIEEYTM